MVDALRAMCECYQRTLQAVFNEAKMAAAALKAELVSLREREGVLLQHTPYCTRGG